MASYDDKPMKYGWQKIDGKDVPFVYPQYWSEDKGDWIITSEENRLPVDAKLTGSKVKLAEELAYEIGAGSRAYAVSVINQDINYFRATVAVGQKHDFDVFVTHGVAETGAPEASRSMLYEINGDDFKKHSRVVYTPKNIPSYAGTVQIRVVNNSEEKQEYDVRLWGVLS